VVLTNACRPVGFREVLPHALGIIILFNVTSNFELQLDTGQSMCQIMDKCNIIKIISYFMHVLRHDYTTNDELQQTLSD